jgi:hypothetical protein
VALLLLLCLAVSVDATIIVGHLAHVS